MLSFFKFCFRHFDYLPFATGNETAKRILKASRNHQTAKSAIIRMRRSPLYLYTCTLDIVISSIKVYCEHRRPIISTEWQHRIRACVWLFWQLTISCSELRLYCGMVGRCIHLCVAPLFLFLCVCYINHRNLAWWHLRLLCESALNSMARDNLNI